jgi:hypothetical protein
MDANNCAGSNLVVAKEEERSIPTMQQSLNGKRKDLSIKSNVHLLQEENKDERKKSERSIELHDHHATQLHDHDGTKSPQLVSSKWTKRSQQLSSSKNENFIHATKKQKQHYPYKDFMPRPSSFINVDPRHINNYKRNKGKKEKDGTATDPTSNYASGITFDPSVWFCEISEPHRHQEELRAPITITDL